MEDRSWKLVSNLTRIFYPAPWRSCPRISCYLCRKHRYIHAWYKRKWTIFVCLCASCGLLFLWTLSSQPCSTQTTCVQQYTTENYTYSSTTTEITYSSATTAANIVEEADYANISQYNATQQCREQRHLVFIKTHKTASSTVAALIFRFGMRRKLTFGVPSYGHQLRYFTHENETLINETLAEVEYWRYRLIRQSLYESKFTTEKFLEETLSQIVFLPETDGHNMIPNQIGTPYDIICNHAIYKKKELTTIMPPDTVYFTILRHPLSQLASALRYYYHKRIPGPNRTHIYLADPQKYITPDRFFLVSPMSRELGLEPNQFYNKTRIYEVIINVDKNFMLVLISEYLAESLVMLKRRLCWTWKDMLYMSQKVMIPRPDIPTDPKLLETHRVISMADYMLYDHFLEKFKDKLAREGDEFQRDVARYTKVLLELPEYCNSTTHSEPHILADMQDWGGEWAAVGQLPHLECRKLQSDSSVYTIFLRYQAVKRAAAIQVPAR